MRNIKDYINESKINFDFYTFCDAIENYTYNNKSWNAATGSYVIYIKDIFNKDTIRCNGAGVDNMNKFISKYEAIDVDYIYIDRNNKRSLGVHGKKFGYIYLQNINDLIQCFGETNLIEIYKFISK